MTDPLAKARGGWQPIETVPHNTYVDLWIVGEDDWVDFYAPDARKVPGKPQRHGRATHYMLCADGKWRSNVGLGYAMSPDVTPTHWMSRPDPPLSREAKPSGPPKPDTETGKQ